MRLELDWEVGPTPSLNVMPTEWVPARVPGCAQRDWARAKGWPDVEWAGNVSDYDGLEDLFWVYRAIIPEGVGSDWHLVVEGVDYECTVKDQSGSKLHHFRGLYHPCLVPIDGKLTTGDPIYLWVHPAPKSRPGKPFYMQADASTKPAVSYEWDFHPRLIPLGLWKPVYLEPERTRPILTRFEVKTLDLGAKALVSGMADRDPLNDQACEITVELVDGDGKVLAAQQIGERNSFCFELDQPRLWWPRGHGDQPMYQLRLTADGEVVDGTRFGIRDTKLVMHPTQWNEIKEYPAGRTTSPITLQINGRRIFAKGCNWVCPTMFPGELTDELIEEQLRLAYDLGVNILRCWGGAAMMPQRFYDLCDELGIMVWQEFPLACNRYEGTDEYLAVLNQEGRAMLDQLRPHHPCVVMWCGGNELFNNWSLMTDQDLALRLLDKLCYEHDRDTPYLMTSPAMGMAHGGYMFHRGDGREVFEYFPECTYTAYTEFGTCGPCDLETLERIIPKEERWPIQPGGTWSLRHAVNEEGTFWRLDLPAVRKYFGEPESLAELVSGAQWLQAESFRFVYEEARRQHPTCSMALNWCFNEPWPDAANNSLLAWPSTPKPAYDAVKSSLRPTLFSGRVPHFSWASGDEFSIQMFLLNDSLDATGPVTVEVTLRCGGQTVEVGTWDCPDGEAQTNVQGPLMKTVLPALPRGELRVDLHCAERREWSQSYRLWCSG